MTSKTFAELLIDFDDSVNSGCYRFVYVDVGSFFERYPRHDQLISINKRHTGKTNVEFNMRHDWNSLVTDVDDEQVVMFLKERSQLQ